MSSSRNSYSRIYDRRRANQSRLCAHPQCSKMRRGLSKFCSYHEGRYTRYGHPDGYRVRSWQYLTEAEEAKAFIEKWSTHKAVLCGTEWFDTWLKNATLGLPVPGKVDFRNLADHGVTGKECLIAVLTIWLYSCRRPAALPSDIRMTFALALAVLGLAPREKRLSWKDGQPKEYGRNIGHRTRRDVGKLIRTTLALFARNAIEAIHKELEKENYTKLALAKSFEQPDTLQN